MSAAEADNGGVLKDESADFKAFLEGPQEPFTPPVPGGSGPARRSEYMGQSRPFADGGGLCSAGR